MATLQLMVSHSKVARLFSIAENAINGFVFKKRLMTGTFLQDRKTEREREEDNILLPGSAIATAYSRNAFSFSSFVENSL